MTKFKTFKRLMILVMFSLVFISFSERKIKENDPFSAINITFHNTINGAKIVLNDSVYSNPFKEKYTITKLRYYITNVCLHGPKKNFKEKNSYHLIDESESGSQIIRFNIPVGIYDSLTFLLGVDSLHNVSGAQTDDLDPTKDMFWTWNTGYVMAKMEGNSSASKLVNNKYEFHIGGYAGPYQVIKKIKMGLSPRDLIVFKAGQTTEIYINADINTWWKGANDIKIADRANITSPGKFALAISDNYAKMFSVKDISTCAKTPGD